MNIFLKKTINNNNIISLCGTGIIIILMAIGFCLMLRTYSKQEIGEWIIYSTGLQFVEMFRSGLLFIALIKFLSGSNNIEEKKEIIGSIWILGLLSTIIIILLSFILFFKFEELFINKGFLLYFQLFPLSFILFLPINISISILASQQQFKKILFIKLGFNFPPVLFLFLNYFFFNLNIFFVTLIYSLLYLPITIYCIADGSSGIQYIFRASKSYLKKLLNFGKFSMLTLLAANLLRSSDVYIIGLFLTNTDVAIYGIPLKIINIFENTLNSFCDVAMPSVSKEAGANNFHGIKNIYYKYSTFITLLLIPTTLVLIISSNLIIWIIGGSQYLNNPEIYYVLIIFLLSFLLQPTERFTGVVLDSINKPGLNLIKVITMASINIIGDIIVIIIFKSITGVALVTMLNVIIGVIIGLILLKKEANINLKEYFIYIKSELKIFLSTIKLN